MANPSVHDDPADAAAVAPASKGPDTCGYVQFPVTTLRFPMIARPWTCPKPEQTCTSSGSYAGCTTPVPTRCRGSSLESSIIASVCADDELCCRWRPNTACYTWLSTQGPSTYTLYECRSTSGVGTLLASPTGVSGTPGATSPINPTASQPGGFRPPPPDTPLPTSPQERPESNSGGGEAPPGAVAASIAGAIAFLGLLAGGVVYLWMWSKKKKRREGTLHRRTSMAISGPFMVSGAPPKVPPPPRGYEMRRFEVGGNAAPSSPSEYSQDGRVSEGVVPVVGEAPKRPRRSGDGGIWI